MPILGSNSSGGSHPSAPVIGSATDGGTGTTASVAFTPSTYIGKGTITYTATSSPGGLTATGSSPITVTGLTTGTAYTFTVQGTTNYGVTSEVSSASNSVTPATPSDFYSIATVNPSGLSQVTFNSIPGGYQHLQLRTFTKISASSSSVELEMWYNAFPPGTGGDLCTFRGIYADGTSSLRTWNAASNGAMRIADASIGSANSNTNAYAVGIVDIFDYTSSKYKMMTYRSGGIYVKSTEFYHVGFGSGLTARTNAITSITLNNPAGGTWSAGTQFALYAIGN